MNPGRRNAFLAAALAGGLAGTSAGAAAGAAAELVMFMSPACSWCALWEEEVGRIYPRTDEARAFPLRRVDLERGTDGGVSLASPVRYTPTFVLAACGREVGRITGYPGEAHFWGLLAAAIERSRSDGHAAAGRC